MTQTIVCVCMYVHADVCTLMNTNCTHLQICLCLIVISFHGDGNKAGQGNQQRELI